MSVNAHSAAKWGEGYVEIDDGQIDSRKKWTSVAYCQDERPFGNVAVSRVSSNSPLPNKYALVIIAARTVTCLERQSFLAL